MRNWEVRLALQYGRDHKPLPFRVGADWWMDEFDELAGPDDLEGLTAIADRWCANSEQFYRIAEGEVPFEVKPGLVTFPSRGTTDQERNRTVYMAYRPLEEGGPITLALPAWNTQRWRFKSLLPTIRQLGFGGASLSLPYQDERMPAQWTYAQGLISSDLGLTLRAIQQSVLDSMDAISVLRQLGHAKIIVLGTSIGSGVLNLLDAHDPRPDGVLCVLCADSFARCVWNGVSTRHLRKVLERHIGLDELDRVWRPISAGSYVDRLANQPRPMRAMLTTRYDYTFPHENGRRLRELFAKHGVDHTWSEMSCGHYTLSRSPFSLRFLLWLKNRLRQAAALPDRRLSI